MFVAARRRAPVVSSAKGTRHAFADTMTTIAIRLPRVSTDKDLIGTFRAFHEAMRDVAAWIPTIIDEGGNASPRDARWLRSFLNGPLVWHVEDEENIVVPWLSMRQSDWLDACLARTCEKHDEVLERARELLAIIDPLCSGEPVPRPRFLNAARRFEQAVESDLRYEDDILLPSTRTFLDAAERAAMAKQIVATDETRPWLDAEVAGDAPVVHRVHTVRTRSADGLDIVRSFADCPRRRATDVAACAGCPHMEDIQVDATGAGQVSCAIDDTRPSNDARVSDIMTRNVVCIEKEAPLTDAAELLAGACVSGLPVVDDAGRPLGVVSQSDIVDALARSGDVAKLRVADVMMHVPIVVRESDAVGDAAKLLVIEGIHRLPVINADRVVVGIVSTMDVLRASITSPHTRTPQELTR
jgi:CBS domain-containing protein